MRLTEDELVLFREEGFVVKHNMLDSDLMAQSRNLLWDSAPPSIRRDKPSSWIGPIKEDEEGVRVERLEEVVQLRGELEARGLAGDADGDSGAMAERAMQHSTRGGGTRRSSGAWS